MIQLVYVSRIKLRGFKSFRHADIPLSKGFVCLAGPNGSGKSNVTDGLRFVFGEMSLKALRAKKISELINQSCSKAEVIVELDGDRKTEIRRAISDDGKAVYRMDGKRATRTEVMEALRNYGYDAGSHNVIAQGQAQKIIDMSSKERREIIDSVAGISEFEQKKDEALRELEKVEQKITEANTVLNERSGFLSQLEKEKDDALQYMEASTLHKRARASLVHYDLEKVNKAYSDAVSRQLALKEEADRLRKDIDILDQRISEIEARKAAVSSKINSRSEQNETYQALQSLELTLTSDRNSVTEKSRETERLKGKLKSLEEEKKSLSDKHKSLLSEIADARKQVAECSKQIEKFEKENRAELQRAKGRSIAELKSNVESLGSLLEEKKEERAKLEADAARFDEIGRMRNDELARTGKPAADTGRIDKLESEISVLSSEIASLGKELDSLFADEKRLNRELPELDRKVLDIKEKVAIVRASVSPAGANLAVKTVGGLKDSGAVKGIYGTVGDLVRFEPEYATAIEAAAGQRLSYIVVENLDVATKAIEHLKSQKAGRCTFIPIDCIISSVSSETAQIAKSPGSLGFLMDFVQFDKRFYNAMEYVFGGTVLVSSIPSAKKLGVGKARMVTREGELLERSGTITGGTFKASLASRGQLDKLDAELELLKQQRGAGYESMNSLREKMANKRRERAEIEVKLKGMEIELSSLTQKDGARDAAALIEKLSSEAEGALRSAEEARKAFASVSSEIKGMEKERESARSLLSSTEQKHTEEMSEIERTVSELFTKRSSLDAEAKAKEREKGMLDERLASNSSEHGGISSDLQNLKDELRLIEERITSNSKLREEKERKMKDISASMESLFNQLKKYEGELADVAQQRGKLRAEEERKLNDLRDLDVKRASSEYRLTDLKAAFEELKDVPLIDGNKGELEQITRKSEETIALIPNPNLQAPQRYEEMKRDIEDVKVRVQKLAEEKSAVLSMIDEIDLKKRNIFMETFNKVNDNFRKIFGYVFKGEGLLVLDQPSDPLNSGLLMRVRDDKRERYLDSMSGGEKSLLALLFIFAIQLYRPAPFYILDEADSALDKDNSKKFANLLRELSARTQLIVVTHNDAVLTAAEVALGVAMTPDGSKIVGIQLEKITQAQPASQSA